MKAVARGDILRNVKTGLLVKVRNLDERNGIFSNSKIVVLELLDGGIIVKLADVVRVRYVPYTGDLNEAYGKDAQVGQYQVYRGSGGVKGTDTSSLDGEAGDKTSQLDSYRHISERQFPREAARQPRLERLRSVKDDGDRRRAESATRTSLCDNGTLDQREGCEVPSGRVETGHAKSDADTDASVLPEVQSSTR